MTQEIKNIIENKKIIAICRKIYSEDLINLAAAINRGGINLLEVTYDQIDPDCVKKTTEAIKAVRLSNPDMFVGAGTVLTCDQVKAAFDAGAKYIISPNTDAEIIEHTKKLGMISIPGAMTPTEIITAHNAGADYVKLFPCGSLGPAYIKDVISPINHIKMMAVGGITLENMAGFLSLGIIGVGIGGTLCSKKLIVEGRFDQLEENARKFVEIAAIK
jgi:2-dehydro-3-deoxyphosphogluconate aldolase/(4S)-4-hydroxy-2-oxoglutarate aldolase